jgi:hypothetical protein
MLTWKMRIAVLWVFGAVVQAAVMLLSLFEPGAIRDLMAGTWSGADAHSSGVQIVLVIDLLAPMAMAFLTLVLDDVANRRTNLAVGSFGTFTAILSLIGVLSGTSGAGVTVAVLVGTVVGLSIVWHAWKWPHPSEATPPQRRQAMARPGA